MRLPFMLAQQRRQLVAGPALQPVQHLIRRPSVTRGNRVRCLDDTVRPGSAGGPTGA